MRTAPVDVITTSLKLELMIKRKKVKPQEKLLSVTAITPSHIVYFRKSHCCSRFTAAVSDDLIAVDFTFSLMKLYEVATCLNLKFHGLNFPSKATN